MFVVQHTSIWPNLILIALKRDVDLTKSQKPRYLENETFFLQMKKIINYTSKATL